MHVMKVKQDKFETDFIELKDDVANVKGEMNTLTKDVYLVKEDLESFKIE